MINYNTGAEDIPTFSLADLHGCDGEAGTSFFARHFKDKIVLIGSTLDIEDRHLTAKRFAKPHDPDYRPDRCQLPLAGNPGGAPVERRTLPGVFIHAAAIHTVTKDRHLALPGFLGNFAIVAGVTAIAALIFFILSPLVGLFSGAALTLLQGGAAVVALQHGLLLPIYACVLAVFLAFAAIYAYRFVVENRVKRRIHNAFQHYLAPALVDRLAERGEGLSLGGESRRVTVWFSDIVGYSSLSENLDDEPEKLVEVVNRYFTLLTDIVQRHSGYVDKFIGDAVMCVWGAPVDDPEAERHALEAALECQTALTAFNRDVVIGEFGLPPIGTRIGINSGHAIAGNMGGVTRFNYTVTGDTVNLASRLEGANKNYGSQIMVSEETAAAAGPGFVLRFLDDLVVKGRSAPVKTYELLGRAGEIGRQRLARIEAFEAAVALYREGRFREAEAAFAPLAKGDQAASLYRERCRHYQANPPAETWDGSFVMTEK